MSETERVVATAARLYDARRAVRTLFGEERFRAKIGEVQPIIEEYMRQHQVDTLEAAIAMAGPLENPHAQVLILATAVEMLEPS